MSKKYIKSNARISNILLGLIAALFVIAGLLFIANAFDAGIIDKEMSGPISLVIGIGLLASSLLLIVIMNIAEDLHSINDNLSDIAEKLCDEEEEEEEE